MTPPSRLIRTLLRSPPLWTAVALGALGIGLAHALGGAAGAREALDSLGLWGPALAVPVQTLLAAAPVPSELFTIATGAAYGWSFGTLVGWLGWTAGSMIQYGLARRGAQQAQIAPERLAKLPRWIRRFPVSHPVFLICVRWLPMGYHLVNVSAGACRVSPARQLWTAAAGSLPGAMLFAGVGAGLVPAFT